MPHLLALLTHYKYLVIFPLACIEGPIVALVVGFMSHLGYISILPAFFVMLLGDFFPDSIYYYIGRLSNKEKLLSKYDTKTKLISRHFVYLDRVWHKHTWKTMFVCKLAYGLSTPLLILAGLVRLPYWKFIYRSLTVTVLNYGLLVLLGYYLGQSYEKAIPYVKNIGIIIAIVAIVFVFIYFLIQRYIKNKITEEVEEQKL